MEKEIGAPSMYQTTKVWFEGKDNESWKEIHAQYYKDAEKEYIDFFDWLKTNYFAPQKK